MTNDYILTPTAAAHYRKIMRYTKRAHGPAQVKKYAKQLKEGFKNLSDGHADSVNKREDMKAGSGFELQHIEHHYAVYKIIKDDTYVIAAILHDEMDIPERLKELQNMRRHEISIIEQQITQQGQPTGKNSPTPTQSPQAGTYKPWEDPNRPKRPGKETGAKPAKKKETAKALPPAERAGKDDKGRGGRGD